MTNNPPEGLPESFPGDYVDDYMEMNAPTLFVPALAAVVAVVAGAVLGLVALMNTDPAAEAPGETLVKYEKVR